MKNKLGHHILTAGAAILLISMSQGAAASYPSGYYNSLDGKCGRSLMLAVKNVAASHKVISYGSSTWEAFRSTDIRTVNGVDYWWDMYSNNLVKANNGHGDMNIEHSVANSWWGKTKNDAYKDIVHLNPSDREANSHKGNYPLCELQSVSWDNGVTFVGKPKSGQGGGASSGYEPADEYKGDFARVFMYMFTIYDDISWKSNTAWMYSTSDELMFKPWAVELLLRWSNNDPVSEKERNRNDGIYTEQHNRNPFIDLPDLADHIWGSKSNVPYSLNGDNPDNPDEPDNVIYNWLSPSSSSIDSGWTYEDVTLPSAGSYVWSWKSHNGKYYLNGSAYIAGNAYPSEAYAWSPVIDMTGVERATFSFDHAARYQTTLRDLCRVAVKDADSGDITLLDIPSWPVADSWTFSSSGDIDLTGFSGHKVNVGFLYKSTSEGADTWEINNAKLTLHRVKSGVHDVPGIDSDSDDSFLVEVWGNNILAPEGARIYDMNGRQVSGENLSRGIYVVTKSTFRKAVKVMIK